MTPRLNRWLLAIVLIIGLPTYWLLIDNRPGDAQPKPLNIAELRSLALSEPGSAPVEIRFESVGKALRVRAFAGAGRGLRPDRLFVLTYKLVVPGKPPIIIGSGMTGWQARKLDFQTYHSDAQKRVEQALHAASHVIPLANGVTHTGGLKPLAGTPTGERIEDWLDMLEAADRAGRPHAVARGVVVIPTQSLGKGNRLVYVRLAQGREYLFAGSLARTRANWTELRAPARIMTDYVQKQDRREIYSWLLTLRKLKREAPGLVIVSGNMIPKKAGLEPYFLETMAR